MRRMLSIRDRPPDRAYQGDCQKNKQDFGECLSDYLILGVLFICFRNGIDLFVCLYRFAKKSFGPGVQRVARGLRKDGPLIYRLYLQHVETCGNYFAQKATDQYSMNTGNHYSTLYRTRL
jgi:hypothetical protein